MCSQAAQRHSNGSAAKIIPQFGLCRIFHNSFGRGHLSKNDKSAAVAPARVG
jgi:hypothetical protein